MNKKQQEQWIKSECEWYTQLYKKKCVYSAEELTKVCNIQSLK